MYCHQEVKNDNYIHQGATELTPIQYQTEIQRMRTLSQQMSIPFYDIYDFTLDPALQNLVPYTLAKRHYLVPVGIKDGKLLIAMDNPLDHIAIDDVRMTAHMEVTAILTYRQAIDHAITRLYGNNKAECAIREYQNENKGTTQEASSYPRIDMMSNAPIIRLINSIIEEAQAQSASDIHIEPTRDTVRIRYRIDGRLQTMMHIPKETHSAVITRIKVMGSLNISEKRLPQDGRLEEFYQDGSVDIRVSIVPTIHGEKIVLRILNRASLMFTSEQLGFTQDNRIKFNSLLMNTHGIILVTGPTGSGKTTSLYAMLHHLNKDDNNIITIENPVEYTLQGINQMQVNNKTGFTFATGLKAVLRQDPDIIMVGEIRDEETAEIALRAAITGHLVLSTLHTSDAVSAIYRLKDMGIPAYMISAAFSGIISQRLLRRLCIHCAQPYEYEGANISALGLMKGDVLYRAVGCGLCNNVGYKGRIAIHEILVINEEHRSLIIQNPSMDVLHRKAMESGMQTLKDGCASLLDKGITSLDEVYRAVFSQIIL